MTSKIEVDAFVSMVLVSLPFPPLPIVCLRSDSCLESFASGHDLLSSAIAAMIVGNDNISPHYTSVEMKEKKEGILIKLNDDIADTWRRRVPSSKESEQLAVEECYTILCSSFRNYMSCYPGSPDLRMMQMNDVDGSTTIVKQAVEHLDARTITFVDEDVVRCKIPVGARSNYQKLIKFYISDIYAHSRETQTSFE